MTRTQLITELTRAGYDARLTPTGLEVEGISIIHSDKTGISQFKRSRVRAKDSFDLLEHLATDCGIHITSKQRKIISKHNKL